MKAFSFFFGYLGWHYVDGSKIVWKSVTQLLQFVSSVFGARAVFKLFPTHSNALTKKGSGSLIDVMLSFAIHIFAFILRMIVVIISAGVYLVSFTTGITVFILWLFFPFIIMLFVVGIVREFLMEI